MTKTEKNYLIIINDSPFGNERAYNGLRMAINLSQRAGTKVRVFPIGDAVNCAQKNQKTPDGYYNIERMLGSLTRRGEAAP